MVALRIKQPLPAGVEAVIRAVQAGAAQLGLEPLLVGATARDLLLVHVFEQPVRRATLDVDFFGDTGGGIGQLGAVRGAEAEVDQRVWLPGRAATKAAADLRG